ncbi:MAG TPA: S1 RNA-binding domain-containing protein, partial [Nitrospirota bacterium]|nr:S1 RNA-binding domain-containing protein [Nitrospirota bacterium]
AELAGKVFPFRITEYAEGGRNIVLSRRALLDEARKTARHELRERLAEGMRMKGRVVSLKDFGAFVDIGGIEGMIPVSEIAWGRTGKASDVLSLGQEVEVIIKKLDWEKDRISLSLKDALPDPWESIEQTLPVGSFQNGTVARLMAFGAFVTLPNGMDGLIHISKLGGGKRISHPKEVLKEGQTVEVKIEAIDRGNRKLSLSLAEVSREEEEAAATLREYKQREATDTRSMGTLGDLLKTKLEKKEKK